MKRTNLLRNITLGMVLSGFACSSCTDFDELNTDPTRMEKVNPGTRFFTTWALITGTVITTTHFL